MHVSEVMLRCCAQIVRAQHALFTHPDPDTEPRAWLNLTMLKGGWIQSAKEICRRSRVEQSYHTRHEDMATQTLAPPSTLVSV
jgi:hypothetical protein